MATRNTPPATDPQPTLGEELKANAAGEQISPGVHDGTDQEPQEPMVKYVGEFGRREITFEQWAQANVADMPTIVWERRSGFVVPKSAFTEQALQVLRQDGGFEVP